ncbi:unnamed protein product [Parnassius apollo]|uniref:(apollo) hypothetical protein n=1 Tax=Parnassius apollo TaxID=110799 RepID=A0A8S3WC08_PARAO|nr:unnamed protein product [Parnassius apollo]
MHEIYYPKKNLVIDESMMLWKGRLKFRQYVKGKRHKHGLKIYMLADQLGIACRIHLYGGSADNLVGGTNHVKKVVLHLLGNYKNMGHSLFIDNFYTSVALSGQLQAIEVYSTGTLNTRRKDIPEEIKTTKLKTGEAAIMHKNGLCIIVWKDKREIMALSNKYNAEYIETRNRRGQVKCKPNMIAQYTKHMKSVDHHDQMMAYYSCEHKSLIWASGPSGIHKVNTPRKRRVINRFAASFEINNKKKTTTIEHRKAKESEKRAKRVLVKKIKDHPLTMINKIPMMILNFSDIENRRNMKCLPQVELLVYLEQLVLIVIPT